MSLKVAIHEVDTRLEIKAVGPSSLADLCELFQRAKAEGQKFSRPDVIIDLTELTGTLSVMDMFVLGGHCSMDWKPAFRIAIVSPAGGLDDFFEDVARNRGAQVVVVPNHAAARQWLGMTRPATSGGQLPSAT
jgi:hypothetical protein